MDAFVITLAPLLLVDVLLFEVLMMTTADSKRASAFGFSTSGAIATASALLFVVMLAHTHLRQQFSGVGIVYLKLFFLTTDAAILAVTVNQYLFTAGGTSRLAKLVKHREKMIVKLCIWPAALSRLSLITWVYFGRGFVSLR